ncbi:hypothetical protein OJ998_00980 [Solirubrobacter taibaiensis]|nr:hypothetical protein [Solirubrobacter taibaiensis]
MPRRLARGALPTLVVALAAPAVAGGQATSARCPNPSGSAPRYSGPVKTAVSLQPEGSSTSQVINFGSGRKADYRQFNIAVQSGTDDLPPVIDDRLVLVADQMLRVGDTTDSVTFPEPTFSQIKQTGNRKRVRFTACLTPPADLPAGRYVGVITLEGPPGIEPTTVTITANVKDGVGFRIAVVVAGLLAFLVLLYKGANDERGRRLRDLEAANVTRELDGEPNQAYVIAESWSRAAAARLRDPGWLGPSLAAIVSTFGALAAAYLNNPAWGESGLVASATALIGTALAAVGAKELFTASGSR